MWKDKDWFTEECAGAGTAFSLRLGRKRADHRGALQTIEIYETAQFGYLMVIDGFIMLSSRDHYFYHEMMVHPALFTHPQPQDVVIIGGGDCGSLTEVLRHASVKTVWQIEIDEMVTHLAKQYFPELCATNDDERAHFVYGDGLEWIEAVAPESIDIIIVDSTDPIGPAEGLFGQAFYRHCFTALRDGGLFVQQSASPLLHMPMLKSMHQALRATGFDQLSLINFPQCVYPSGWWTATMAAKGRSLATFRQDDVVHKRFETRYYNEAIHVASQAQSPQIKAQLFSGRL